MNAFTFERSSRPTDARRLLQDDPWIARRGDALQEIVRERLLRPRVLGIDDRRLSRHRHRFLNGRDASVTLPKISPVCCCA